jgi:hypothetical protein
LGLSSCFILLGSALLYASCGLTSLDGIYVFYNIISEFGEPISNIYSKYPQRLSIFDLLPDDLGNYLCGIKLSNSGNTLELLVPSTIERLVGG